MRPNLTPGNLFPDIELPDHTGQVVRLSEMMRGWPTIVTFGRGLHCREDRRQLTNYAQYLYPDLKVSYCNLITITVENFLSTLEMRESVGAYWPFLCDFERKVINELEIVDVTDPTYSPIAVPYTFVLHGDRRIHKIYEGWWYPARPTADELLHDLRAVRALRPDWGYPADPPVVEPPEALRPGQIFPDFELPDHDGQPARLSQLVGGWPTALIFIRGAHCPKCMRQMMNYVRDLQADMRPGYYNLVTVSADDVGQSRSVRTMVGAEWPFLADEGCRLIRDLGLVDTTDAAHSPIAIPFTFVLDGDLTIHKAYFGWWHVGRPTAEDLRRDFRELMARRPDWGYSDTYDYHAIHSDTMYGLTHGMMDHFIDQAHERQPK